LRLAGYRTHHHEAFSSLGNAEVGRVQESVLQLVSQRLKKASCFLEGYAAIHPLEARDILEKERARSKMCDDTYELEKEIVSWIGLVLPASGAESLTGWSASDQIDPPGSRLRVDRVGQEVEIESSNVPSKDVDPRMVEGMGEGWLWMELDGGSYMDPYGLKALG
jgi:hypothetical protein